MVYWERRHVDERGEEPSKGGSTDGIAEKPQCLRLPEYEFGVQSAEMPVSADCF